jgi:2-oxoglutarate dehydrogenase complex, dehydrogenase (E1) component, and related enzymes
MCCSSVPEIELRHYGLNETDRFSFSGILYAPVAEGTVADAVSFLQKTYSSNMSAEFTYLEVFVLYIESTASTFTKLDCSVTAHGFESHSPYICNAGN